MRKGRITKKYRLQGRNKGVPSVTLPPAPKAKICKVSAWKQSLVKLYDKKRRHLTFKWVAGDGFVRFYHVLTKLATLWKPFTTPPDFLYYTNVATPDTKYDHAGI